MIFDTFSHADAYRHLRPRFAAAFDWLTAFNPGQPDGRCEVEGDNVFALVQSYSTTEPSEKKFESHREYIDLQYVAAGHEDIYFAPITQLEAATLYNGEKDFLLYAEPAASSALHFSPGCFAIFFPQDGHKPGCIQRLREPVKKVVVKIRL